MCKLRHKVRNGQNIPRENEISSFSNLVFSNQNLNFQFRPSKTYSFNPFDLKNLKLILINWPAIRFTGQNEP